MPNGRSGGFRLKRSVLLQLLGESADDQAVGKTLKTPVTVAALKAALEQGKNDVMVEEQDHSWYILHLQEWVTVGADSPLFWGLRQHHAETLKRPERSTEGHAKFSSRSKVHENPTYGRVLEVAFAGSSEGEQHPFPAGKILQEEVAKHLPEHLVINLLEFDYRFGDALPGALVAGLVAAHKLGPGRKVRILAAGQTSANLDKVLTEFKTANLFGGQTYSDMDTALAHVSPGEESDFARAVSQPEATAAREEGGTRRRGDLGFPNLEPGDRMLFAHVAAIILLSALLSMLVAWIWKFLYWTKAIPGTVAVLYVLFRLSMGARNWVLRFRWAQTLNGRMTAHQALRLLEGEPRRYLVHSCSYGGGFDAERLTPATCIEDTQSATLIAVFPPSSRFEAAAERLGTRVQRYS